MSIHDGAQAGTGGELSEGHAEELVEAGEGLHTVIAALARDAAVERVQREVVHQLREHEATGMHD